MPTEWQKCVLVYVCEEQWERTHFVIFWAAYQIPGEELAPEFQIDPKLTQIEAGTFL